MLKSNKGISTSIGIFIVVLVALLAGGILAWRYWQMSKEEVKIWEEKASRETTEETKEKKDRILLTEENIEKTWGEKSMKGEDLCIEFNADPSTTDVLFISREKRYLHENSL